MLFAYRFGNVHKITDIRGGVACAWLQMAIEHFDENIAHRLKKIIGVQHHPKLVGHHNLPFPAAAFIQHEVMLPCDVNVVCFPAGLHSLHRLGASGRHHPLRTLFRSVVTWRLYADPPVECPAGSR